MTPEDLDRILSLERPPGAFIRLAMDVMSTARRQAAESSRLQFPWFRFVAGLAASGGMAAGGTVLLLRSAPALAAMTARWLHWARSRRGSWRHWIYTYTVPKPCGFGKPPGRI
jgi:hypothetical protein